MPKIEGRRLRFDDCTDCEQAFDAVCDAAPSVCDLVDFGYPFTATAAASIDTVCGTFESACSRLEASVACQDQCPEEGVYYCKPRLVHSLASSTSICLSYVSRRCVTVYHQPIGSTGGKTQPFSALQKLPSVFQIKYSDFGPRRGAATVTWGLIETPEYVGTLTIRRPHVILQLVRCQDRTIFMRNDILQIAGYPLLPLVSTSWIHIYSGRRRWRRRRRRRQQQQLVPRPYQRGF